MFALPPGEGMSSTLRCRVGGGISRCTDFFLVPSQPFLARKPSRGLVTVEGCDLVDACQIGLLMDVSCSGRLRGAKCSDLRLIDTRDAGFITLSTVYVQRRVPGVCFFTIVHGTDYFCVEAWLDSNRAMSINFPAVPIADKWLPID